MLIDERVQVMMRTCEPPAGAISLALNEFVGCERFARIEFPRAGRLKAGALVGLEKTKGASAVLMLV